MATNSNSNAIRSYLASNPRAMGILFAVTLLLLQADTALAGGCGLIAGP